jgi:hypothetical protein
VLAQNHHGFAARQMDAAVAASDHVLAARDVGAGIDLVFAADGASVTAENEVNRSNYYGEQKNLGQRDAPSKIDRTIAPIASAYGTRIEPREISREICSKTNSSGGKNGRGERI